MTTKTVARCSIYENRPKMCREYPRVDHWAPSECGFSFSGADRGGACDCDIAACCMASRENGEPGGAPIPETAGGQPCKYVEWIEVPTQEQEEEGSVKTASVISVEQLLMRAVGGE